MAVLCSLLTVFQKSAWDQGWCWGICTTSSMLLTLARSTFYFCFVFEKKTWFPHKAPVHWKYTPPLFPTSSNNSVTSTCPGSLYFCRRRCSESHLIPYSSDCPGGSSCPASPGRLLEMQALGPPQILSLESAFKQGPRGSVFLRFVPPCLSPPGGFYSHYRQRGLPVTES